MKYNDLTLGQIEAIVNKLGGMEGVQSFLRGERTLHEQHATSGLFPVSIDYGQSLADMIKAGKYDWKNDDITEKRFPLKGEGVVERTLSLVHFNRIISSDDAMHDMMSENLKEPATIEDLLAFGAKYPKEQRKYPIIALGSSAGVHGHLDVPSLGGLGSKRDLRLIWFDYEWAEDCRFLARNKVSAT